MGQENISMSLSKKSKRSNGNAWLAFLIISLALLFVISQSILEKHNNQIKTWAVERHHTVKSIERIGLLDNDSPWWRYNGDDLCRVILLDHNNQPRTAFFRWNTWSGMEQAWKEK